MEYSIGQVSKLLGLSVEGIRNYEKSGIIASRRESDSNYRMYSYLDITSLLRARMYRSMGFSVRETEELTNNRQLADISAALRSREEAMSAELRIAKYKIRFISRLKELIRDLSPEVGKVRICSQPASYRMEFSHNGEIDFSEETVDIFHKWAEYTPFVHISTRYNGVDTFGGLAIEKEYGDLFQIDSEKNPRICFLPECLCLMITVMEEENGFSDISCIESMKEYARFHRFELCPDMIGHTVIGIEKSTEYKRYRQIYAPIME